MEKALHHGITGLASNAAPSSDFLTIAVDLVNLEGALAYAALNQLSAEAYAALPNAHFAGAQSEMNLIDARLTDARGSLLRGRPKRPRNARWTADAHAVGEATRGSARGLLSWATPPGSAATTHGSRSRSTWPARSPASISGLRRP